VIQGRLHGTLSNEENKYFLLKLKIQLNIFSNLVTKLNFTLFTELKTALQHLFADVGCILCQTNINT
jgi:hypothetical protein